MAAYHTPVKVNQEDLVMMANIRETFEEASKVDPNLIQQYEIAAAAHGIHPHKTTQESRSLWRGYKCS